ncbi:MAG: NACHT domain-containing protein, partial [Planctomycetota bacterium]|nr:NACHT domain-containing protein [Planctomycetota bacterium]
VVIIPGNHDVNRKMCQGARLMAEASEEDFLPPYFEKFQHYQKFYNDFFDGIPDRWFDQGHLFQIYHFKKERILIAGLNSCIMESEQENDHYGHVSVDQIRLATEQCNELDPNQDCLRIAAIHHNYLAASNLDNENLRDANEIQPSLIKGGFHLILHGHRHEAEALQVKPAGAPAPLTILATGSAGLDADALPDHPNQYQVVRIENRNDLTIYMRQYSAKTFGLAGQGKWVADASIADGGILTESLGLAERRPKKKRSGRPAGKRKMRERFRSHLAEDHRYLDLRGFGTAGIRAAIELDPIYISLRAVPRHDEIEREMKRHQPDLERMHRELEIGPAIELCEGQSYRGMVVLGAPGSGKTTLLKFLTLCLAEKRPKSQTGIRPGRFPILLPLRNVKYFNVSLPDALQSHYDSPALNLPQGFFEDLLDDEACLVMLDGLDEVASQTRRKEALDWIEDERKARKDNLILVTSRPAGYQKQDRLPGHYLELHVRDFSDDDIRQFTKLWYREVETKQRGDNELWRQEARKLSDDLVEQIEDKDALKALAQNPLMLQILCLVHRNQGAMPEQRTELYETCVQVLLEKWDEAKGMEVYLSAKQARRVLRVFARWLHSKEGRTRASESEVQSVIVPELEKLKLHANENLDAYLKRILDSVRDRSGIFVGHDLQEYGFQHLSFQEFLTAEEMVKRRESKILIRHFNENWWREVILLTMGMDEDRFQEAFFGQLLGRNRPLDKKEETLALECIREGVAPPLAPFRKVLEDTKTPWQLRHHAVLALRAIGSKAVEGPLLTAAKDPAPQVAGAARELL